MPSLDPFNDIDPLLEALSLSNLDQKTIQEEELASKGFLTVHVDDCVEENGEWITEGDDNDRNIFDVIIDETTCKLFLTLEKFRQSRVPVYQDHTVPPLPIL